MTPGNDAADDIRVLIAHRIAAGADEPFLYQDGHWRDGHWLRRVHARLQSVLHEAGIDQGAPIGLVARNRATHAAALAALVAFGHPVVMVYAAQSPEMIAAELTAIDVAAVLAAPEDWAAVTLDAAIEGATLPIAIGEDAGGQPLIGRAGAPTAAIAWRARDRGTGFEILSSGTTGKPKRIALGWRTMSAAVQEAGTSYAGSTDRVAPGLFLHPLGSISGPAYLLPAFAGGQPVVMLEKFSLDAWLAAVREHRPTRSSLPPAAIQMLLADPNVQPGDLAGLRIVAVGGGSVSAEQQVAFERRFGIPILTAYGATEFGGVIANWTLDDHRRFAAMKRDSAGRASRRVALRVVDPETGTPRAAGETGLLEAKVDRIGTDWIRTNDLAAIDADGFLFICGRADGAINRGGFKVLPEKVAAALCSHRAVRDAAIVARPDTRLGAVPVAAVELSDERCDEETLLSFARAALLRHEVPVEIRIVAALPRTASFKVALGEVAAMMAQPRD